MHPSFPIWEMENEMAPPSRMDSMGMQITEHTASHTEGNDKC